MQLNGVYDIFNNHNNNKMTVSYNLQDKIKCYFNIRMWKCISKEKVEEDDKYVL